SNTSYSTLHLLGFRRLPVTSRPSSSIGNISPVVNTGTRSAKYSPAAMSRGKYASKRSTFVGSCGEATYTTSHARFPASGCSGVCVITHHLIRRTTHPSLSTESLHSHHHRTRRSQPYLRDHLRSRPYSPTTLHRAPASLLE